MAEARAHNQPGRLSALERRQGRSGSHGPGGCRLCRQGALPGSMGVAAGQTFVAKRNPLCGLEQEVGIHLSSGLRSVWRSCRRPRGKRTRQRSSWRGCCLFSTPWCPTGAELKSPTRRQSARLGSVRIGRLISRAGRYGFKI